MSDLVPCLGPISVTCSGFGVFLILSQIWPTVTCTVAKQTQIFLAEASTTIKTENKLDLSYI